MPRPGLTFQTRMAERSRPPSAACFGADGLKSASAASPCSRASPLSSATWVPPPETRRVLTKEEQFYKGLYGADWETCWSSGAASSRKSRSGWSSSCDRHARHRYRDVQIDAANLLARRRLVAHQPLALDPVDAVRPVPGLATMQRRLGIDRPVASTITPSVRGGSSW